MESWINGVVRSNREGYHLLDIVDPTPEDISNFGIDPCGPVAEVQQTVTVPETICPLSETAKQRFLDCLHLMHSDPTPQSDYGISKFIQAKSLLCHLLQDSSSSSTDISD